MVRGREWTGFEAAALQEAMRRSVRDFAALLGLETTTVTNWRTGLGTVKPRSATQAILCPVWIREQAKRFRGAAARPGVPR